MSVGLISTGQHRELLQQALEAFKITADHDLGVMQPGQSLSQLTARILTGLDLLYQNEKPDLVLAHGDTTTCYSTAVSSFYHSIPFFHVEAGLRTYRLDSPFPEEFNRQGVSQLAQHHFAPSSVAKQNLLNDGIKESTITITGNTVRDAIEEVKSQMPPFEKCGRKLVLVTLHRREPGEVLESMMTSIQRAASINKDVLFFFSVHPNPKVKAIAENILSDQENVILSEPLAYREFLTMMLRSTLILTDSGGVQEEAAYLKKNVFVLREKSEREDGIKSGSTKIIGTNPAVILREINRNLREELQVFSPLEAVERSASAIVADTVERAAL